MIQIRVEYGIYGRDVTVVDGFNVCDAYLLFDDLHRDVQGQLRRKLFIGAFVNGVQTSEMPLLDPTVLHDGDLVEFRSLPRPTLRRSNRRRRWRLFP